MDSTYPQQQGGGGGNWQSIKLRDLGDGTFAVGNIDIGAWDKVRISTATTTVVDTGVGILGAIIVNKAVALSTITIYDNTSATGSPIAVITQPLTLLSSQLFLPFKCKMANGITIVTSQADDITVLYI